MRTISDRITTAISRFYSVSPDEVEVFYDEDTGKWVSRYGLVTIVSERGLSTVFVIARCKEMAGYSRVRTDINSTSVHMLTRTLIDASKRAKESSRLASALIQAGLDVHGDPTGCSGEVKIFYRIPFFLEITIRPGKNLGEWELVDDANTLSGLKMTLFNEVTKALDSLGIPRSSDEEEQS